MEAFRSDDSPHIFAQFAQVIDLLRKRSDFLNPDVRWMERFTDLAFAAARGVSPDGAESVRLVHCIELSVAEQLGELAQAGGGASKIKVLSPFFDEDAHGVMTLAKETGSTQIQVGILPGWTESPFPFQKKFPGMRVSAAEISGEILSRGLHAKWIECELKDGAKLVVTGSINSTNQSLCTTHNIEVGVLREESSSARSRLEWKRTSAPETQTVHRFIAPGVGTRIIIYASLSEAGRLHGKICSLKAIEGKWEASLARPDGNSVEFSLQVGPDGAFHQAVPRSDLFEVQSGLQLTLVNGVREARCWVNNEWLLELSRVKAIPLGAIQRFLQGESDEDDDLIFLGFLAEKLHEALPTDLHAHHKGAKSGGRVDKNEHETISVTALAPAEAMTEPTRPGIPSAQSNRLGALVAQLFGRMEENLERPTPKRKLTLRTNVDDDDVDDTDADADVDVDDLADVAEDSSAVENRRRAQREAVLRQLRHAVQTQLTSSQLIRKRVAAHWWLVGEMHHHLKHAKDMEAALRFSREWMIKVAAVLELRDPPEKFDRMFVTIAATLAANALVPGNPKEGLVGIHEALETSGAAKLPVARVQAMVDSSWYTDLDLKAAPPRVDGLVAAFAAPTRRGEVDLIRDALKMRRPLPNDLALLNTNIGRDMRRSWQQGESIKLFVFESAQSRTACPAPSCRMSLQTTALTELERLKITKCVRCGSYLVIP